MSACTRATSASRSRRCVRCSSASRHRRRAQTGDAGVDGGDSFVGDPLERGGHRLVHHPHGLGELGHDVLEPRRHLEELTVDGLVTRRRPFERV